MLNTIKKEKHSVVRINIVLLRSFIITLLYRILKNSKIFNTNKFPREFFYSFLSDG